MSEPLWAPSARQVEEAELTRFAAFVRERHGVEPRDAALHAWSLADPAAFWGCVWDFCGVVAATRGDTVLALIKEGAYPENKNKEDLTPLQIAVIEGQTEAALALIEGGANIQVKGKNDASPLHLAAVEGETETALALIKAGADANALDLFGITPLKAAINEHGETSDIVNALQNAQTGQ